MAFYIPQRYMLTLMCFFAIVNAYTMRVCLNVAITVMVKRNTSSHHVDPDACPQEEAPEGYVATDGEFEWDEVTQGLILGGFFWGYVVMHIPGGLMARTYGGKYVLSLGILSTAVFTLITPVVARTFGSTGLIIVRVLEGFGEGTTMPAINVLLANWAPPTEKSRLGSFAYAGSLIGTVVTQAASGLILHSTNNDWPLVFYTFGILAIVWFIIFTIICYSNPQSHPFISEWELTYLQENIVGIHGLKDQSTPWRHILLSVPLWGLIIAQIGHDWVFFSMVTDLPKYMADVLRFNIRSNGFVSALPYLVMWITSIFFGYMADVIIKRGTCSVTNTRKSFTTVASLGPAAGIMMASYAGCDKVLVVLFFTIAMGFMGTFYPGMKVNALDLSPNFAGVLMAMVNGIGAISGIITPYLVGLLTPDRTLLQWRTFFWITTGVAIVTNLVFVLTASGEIQPWNDLSTKENS